MIKQVAAIRYAKAYYSYCSSKRMKEIVFESEKIIEVISNNPSLNQYLKNKIVNNQSKKKILLRTVGNISENLKNLIQVLAMKNRLNLFCDILNQFIDFYKISSGIETCYLISAEKMSTKIQENIKQIIRKITKNKINIVNIIDKDLIGGFILKVGDIQFDNSVESILSRLNATLKKENISI